MTAICKWCPAEFEPTVRGGRVQEFHAPACRLAYHDAARRFTEALIADKYLTVEALRKWAESNVNDGGSDDTAIQEARTR